MGNTFARPFMSAPGIYPVSKNPELLLRAHDAGSFANRHRERTGMDALDACTVERSPVWVHGSGNFSNHSRGCVDTNRETRSRTGVKRPRLLTWSKEHCADCCKVSGICPCFRVPERRELWDAAAGNQLTEFCREG